MTDSIETFLKNTAQTCLFQLNPEVAHRLAQYWIRLRYSAYFPAKSLQKPVSVFGLSFKNPIGMAAGWDKNAECVDALFRMGFGFVEVGTVTPKSQAGNPRPRLFRIPKKQALINRMGFNNGGVDALVEKIRVRKEPGILGVNIGKNAETDVDHAFEDYAHCLKSVFPFCDYVVINISSPNTPHLRKLQDEHYLLNLLTTLEHTRKQLSGIYQKNLPLLVKTSVDLPKERYHSFIQTLFDCSIDGIIISNTTLDRHGVCDDRYGNEAGGLSGKPLRVPTTEMIQAINTITESKLPIIGVGGILTAEDARAHWQAGATLLQIFTGFVYRGPNLLSEILVEH